MCLSTRYVVDAQIFQVIWDKKKELVYSLKILKLKIAITFL